MSCPHPALLNGLCVACGQFIAQAEQDLHLLWGSELTLTGGTQLRLSNAERHRMEAAKVSSLRSNRKLALVLDLDHTLLHSILVDGPFLPELNVPEQMKRGIYHLPIEEVIAGNTKHIQMKLRPYTMEFLAQASEFCQITIYTAGTRRYAEAVTRVLDPRRQYIKDRIVSRCDVSGVRNEGNDKSLERLFLGDTSLAVVIDDREDVWRGEQSHQLILVKPFVYFSGKGVEVNSRPDGDGLGNASTGQPLAPIVSLLYPGKVLGSAKPFAPEFGDLDDQLWRCLQVLHNIHSKIYSNGSKTNSTNKINSVAQTIQLPLLVEKRKVSDTLIEIKESILAGCTITFSGLIPTNTLRPRQHYLWKLAESLGAQVSQEVLPRTTHLLAMVPPDQKKTAKISECLQRGDVWVVHPDWLIYCRWSLARSAEASFMLYALEPGMQLPAPKLRFDTIAPVQNQSISGQSDNNKRPSSTLLNDNLSEEDRSDDEDRIGKFAKRARTENYDESSKKLSEVLKKAHTIRNPSVVGLLGDDDPEDRLDWTEYENYVDCTHFDDDGDDEDNADYYKHYDNDGSEDYESKFDLARHSNPVVINVSNLDVRRKSRNNVNSEVVASRGMGDGSSDSSSDDCISRELTPIDPNPQTEDLLDGESSDDDFDDLEDILLSRSTK